MKSNRFLRVRFLRVIRPALACLTIGLSLAVCAQAQTINNLGLFDGLNGWEPYSSVIQAPDGNFYGATSGGPGFKANNFQVTPAGELSSIYRWCSQPLCADGNESSPLILGSDGNLYGTTYGGGSRAGAQHGSGTVYNMTTAGELTTLYTFCPAKPCTDGQYPLGIVLASDGNFYGTTSSGGTFDEGTLFRISTTGEFKVLYTFCSLTNCADGSYLMYPPIQAADGNFYGTTFDGGTNNGGVIYKLTPSGTYTVLYDFCSSDQCPAGQYPNSITQGGDGNFYGTTQYGGALQGGVLYELTAASHQYTVVHSFPQSIYGFPQTPLTLASDGNLYGTLGGGGSGSWDPSTLGEIFQFTSAGVFKELAIFHAGRPNGFNPLDPVFQGTDGNFYGTTAYGGLGGDYGGGGVGFGTVFQFSNGLSPLVETVPVGGIAGQSVLILGNGLTGSTSVTFDGVEAEFTVESDTYIKATVPTGATTGTVSVVTPSGTFNSNPQFVVSK
jgi:uncharacterized repeat protein (TIGR03803 family)